MKKLISFLLLAALSLSLVACGNNLENAPADENLSGSNAVVSKVETAKQVEYLFEGFLTTKLPAGTVGRDASINTDTALFSFSNDDVVALDISLNSEGTSKEVMKAKAEEAASFSSASSAGTKTIDNVQFFGANRPDFGYTEYFGHLNGYDITVKVYADKDNDVVKAFFKNTKFVFEN